MTFPLIGLHAWLGEFAALMFVWAFIELSSGADANIRRARTAVLLGLVFLFGAWFAGGYYYVEFYGAQVKPYIKEGPFPWAHGVVMETKEHVFLFLPLLARDEFKSNDMVDCGCDCHGCRFDDHVRVIFIG